MQIPDSRYNFSRDDFCMAPVIANAAYIEQTLLHWKEIHLEIDHK